MKNRITDYILALLSLVLGCYASPINKASFKTLEKFSCKHNEKNNCFPFIIYSDISNYKALSQIVYTMRFRNYTYIPQISQNLEVSEDFVYDASFANIEDPSTFNYNNINYTLYSERTSVINNMGLKFGMITFDIHELPQDINSIVIQITCPSSVENLFEYFEIEVFSYEQPKDPSNISVDIPSNHYFYWLAEKNGPTNQKIIFNKSNSFYLELSPDIISLNATVSFFKRTDNPNLEPVEIATFENETQKDIKSVFSFNVEDPYTFIMMNINYNATADNHTSLIGAYTNQTLFMLKYKTTREVNTELIPLDWTIKKISPFNDKTKTTIRFPPVVAKNGLKLNKVAYIIRVYELDFMHAFFDENVTLPFNFIIDPLHVYSKIYNETPTEEIEITFFLDRGYYVYDLVAYVENGEHIEFTKTALFFFDVIYSEWEPLIVLASIVVGLLIITGGYATIRKKIYKQKHLTQSGDFQTVESLNQE